MISYPNYSTNQHTQRSSALKTTSNQSHHNPTNSDTFSFFFQSTHTNIIINPTSNYATNSPKKHHFNPQHTYKIPSQASTFSFSFLFNFFNSFTHLTTEYSSNISYKASAHTTIIHTNQYNCLQNTATLYTPTKLHLT